MAKKKSTKQMTPSPWTIKFREKADKISEARRARAVPKEVHIPKIPQATLFVNGQKIILNA